jgi:hypothetical protein
MNWAEGSHATACGGGWNRATEGGSFAAGIYAIATNAGAFVWSSNDPTYSWGNDTFTVRAHGGARFYTAAGTGTGVRLAAGGGSWSSLSDRNAKEAFQAVNPREVLDKLVALPVTTWKYKSQDAAIRHMGPCAQDFKAAFGLGESDTGITGVDADGVALAAIQGVNQKLEVRTKEFEARSQKLEERNAALEREVAELKALVQTLAENVNGGGQ